MSTNDHSQDFGDTTAVTRELLMYVADEDLTEATIQEANQLC